MPQNFVDTSKSTCDIFEFNLENKDGSGENSILYTVNTTHVLKYRICRAGKFYRIWDIAEAAETILLL